MKTIKQLLGTVALTLFASTCAFAGPIYTYNGHDYTVVDVNTWEDAEAAAVALGGHLVTINDAAEQAWLHEIFGLAERFWIGFNDVDSEGNFVWSSGDAVTYTNWNGGEPNDYFHGNPGEDYTVMNWVGTGQWNDWFSYIEVRGIAEIASVPEPGTLALLGLGLAGMGMRRRNKVV